MAERVLRFVCHDNLEHVVKIRMGVFTEPAEGAGGDGADFYVFLRVAHDGGQLVFDR